MRKITLLFAAAAIGGGVTVTAALQCRSRRSRPILRRKSSKYVGFVGPMAAAGGAELLPWLPQLRVLPGGASTGTVAIGSDSRGGVKQLRPDLFLTNNSAGPRVQKFKNYGLRNDAMCCPMSAFEGGQLNRAQTPDLFQTLDCHAYDVPAWSSRRVSRKYGTKTSKRVRKKLW